MIVWDVEWYKTVGATAVLMQQGGGFENLPVDFGILWDERRYEELDRVVAIVVKSLAGKLIAFYCYEGDQIPNKKDSISIRYVLKRKPQSDIRKFIYWARSFLSVRRLSPVLGLHHTL